MADTAAAAFALHQVSIERGGRRAIHALTTSISRGEKVALVGPNGSGKTTLLRAMCGLTPISSGSIRADGRPIDEMTPRQRARRIAFLGQDDTIDLPFTSREVIALGRTAQRAEWARASGDDRAAVESIIAALQIEHLADRRLDVMSGGERKRVMIGRALAQGCPAILLDEPSNHLDLDYQLLVLDLLRQSPATAVVAMHDLTSAARFGDRILLIGGGRLVGDGSPHAVLQPDLLAEVYGVSTRPVQGQRLIIEVIDRIPTAGGPARP